MKKKSFGTAIVTALTSTLVTGLSLASTATTYAQARVSQPPLEVLPSPNGNFQDNFNPFSSNNNGGNYGTLGMVYEPLFYFDNVSGKAFSLLGKSYGWSNSNKTLTVQLQTKAGWTDGKAFTSADVVYTFQLLKQYPAADQQGVWSVLQGVKAVGKYAVQFDFKTANVPFAAYVLGQFIVPQHVWSKMGNPLKATVAKPIGTGPYVLASFSPQDYKYNANPNYWGGNPPVKVVDFPAYSGNDSGNLALAKGQIDWAGMFIPGIQNVFIKRDQQHNHYFFPPGNVVMMYTNLKNPMLAQLPVRQAISYAINRSALANEGEYGYTKPASPTGLVLPNNAAWLDPKLPGSAKSFPFNPSKAIQILQAAGFTKNAQGILEKNGHALSFTLKVVAGWTDWDADCQLIEQNLKKIGIAVTVNQEQIGAYNSDIGQAQKHYDLAISWTNTGPSPYFLYYNMLDNHGNYNVEQLNNSQVNGWLSNFSSTSNVSQEKQDVFKLENYMSAQLPSIPLFYGPVWFEYRDANYTGFPTANNPWINPAPWQNYAQAIVLMHLKPTH